MEYLTGSVWHVKVLTVSEFDETDNIFVIAKTPEEVMEAVNWHYKEYDDGKYYVRSIEKLLGVTIIKRVSGDDPKEGAYKELERFYGSDPTDTIDKASYVGMLTLLARMQKVFIQYLLSRLGDSDFAYKDYGPYPRGKQPALNAYERITKLIDQLDI